MATSSEINLQNGGPGIDDPSGAQVPVRSSRTQTTPQAFRILVVDDDDAIRRFATLVLTAAGYHVLTAHSGDEAIAICQQESLPIHLILADVIMPRLSGRQLASQIKSRQPDTLVLLMSGYPSLTGMLNGIASRSEKHKAECEFIQKPFSPSELLRKVGTILDQRTAAPC